MFTNRFRPFASYPRPNGVPVLPEPGTAASRTTTVFAMFRTPTRAAHVSALYVSETLCNSTSGRSRNSVHPEGSSPRAISAGAQTLPPPVSYTHLTLPTICSV